MPSFVTLGPHGSNHAFVLQRYLQAHGILHASHVEYIEDFHEGARMVIERHADFMLQCAVHPAAPEITGKYRQQLFVVDAFISPSRPMALLRSTNAGGAPGRVGVQPATRYYADLSSWPQRVEEASVMEVGRGLLQGRYDAGIAFASLATEHPERFEVVQAIAPVCDAWIVFGPTPVDRGQAIVWTGSPAARLYAGADDAPRGR
ncbi:hypothetical protein C7T35_27915 [Variovorax sp. WS11]|nr:hypothetical protein C7T35_27915 [Variovorax sp. WS11]